MINNNNFKLEVAKKYGYLLVSEGIEFRVWAPGADEVYLCLYAEYNSECLNKVKMLKNQSNIWYVATGKESLNMYYTFCVKTNHNSKEVVDPYAKALSVNGTKGYVLDMATTNPKDWEEYSGPFIKSTTDAIIYELHTRDFTIDSNSGVKARGKFKGLCEENTLSKERLLTGISHIADLGVTHVQILPIFDFGSVDEETDLLPDYEDKGDYNWGYDPMNYNAPEGSYSTNPYEPSIRIKELKETILAFHKKGIGVIMDVVYNHMYDAIKSNFNTLAPEYYFRYNSSGELKNESGCGNVVASEKLMVRKFIVDSIKYWAEEYKLDGFRFDLMGLMDIDTINEIKEELKKVNPNILLLGEGWNMGNTLKAEEKAIQKNAIKMNQVAFFNDEIRDVLRGPYDSEEPGFLNGNTNLKYRVEKSISGGINYKDYLENWGAIEPNQVINYCECHDNHTLYDRLKLNCKDENNLKAMAKLGAAIVLLSQGVPFIHAGQEFLRTKSGIENSYNAGDNVNKIEWAMKQQHLDLFNYFRELIKLRKSTPEFRLQTAIEIENTLLFKEQKGNCISYTISQEKVGNNQWFVIHNGNQEVEEVELDSEQKWKIIFKKGKTYLEEDYMVEDYKVKVDAFDTLVLRSL